MNQDRMPASARKLLWLGALIYTALVIYDSLMPLELRALSWDEAVARFTAIPWLELGVGSRADWAANLILYIRVGYLLTGALAESASGGRVRHIPRRVLLVLIGPDTPRHLCFRE